MLEDRKYNNLASAKNYDDPKLLLPENRITQLSKREENYDAILRRKQGQI